MWAVVLIESHIHGTYGLTLSVGQHPVMQEILIKQGTMQDTGNDHNESSVFLSHWATSRCTFMTMLEIGQRPTETHSNQLFPFHSSLNSLFHMFFLENFVPAQASAFTPLHSTNHSTFSTWAKAGLLSSNVL